MYSLSCNAIQTYRKGTTKYKNITTDVMKKRLNALIEASTNKTACLNGYVYKFGSLRIKVVDNIIREVKFSDEKTPATAFEVKRMYSNFRRYGLNSNGNKEI